MTLICNCALPAIDPTACSRCSMYINEMNRTRQITYPNIEFVQPNMEHLYTLESWRKVFDDMKEPTPITFDPPV